MCILTAHVAISCQVMHRAYALRKKYTCWIQWWWTLSYLNPCHGLYNIIISYLHSDPRLSFDRSFPHSTDSLHFSKIIIIIIIIIIILNMRSLSYFVFCTNWGVHYLQVFFSEPNNFYMKEQRQLQKFTK